MIKYYTNRELSRKLRINLARWKRWSREFLPPDPLGGMQSGYARQYTPDSAFTVFLGGYLVAYMKFTIPQAKQILKDLHGWLVDNGFYFLDKGNSKTSDSNVIYKYVIYIYENSLSGEHIDFYYKIRGIISESPVDYKGRQVCEELYMETTIKQPDKKATELDTIKVKMLNITGVRNELSERLGLNSHLP
ncbi:MAG: hypothetical protein U9Q84_05440 [Thermodesulfobacteriota bacterium]|nr:hypothetical protein [Thermodesulfobacteriota bacterium]